MPVNNDKEALVVDTHSAMSIVNADSKHPESKNSVRVKPFLRWVGGKQQIVSHLVRLLPKDISSRQYVEPFVGAGSLFFALSPESAALSDLNEHLVNCYKSVRDAPKSVAVHLSKHRSQSCRDYYNEQRDIYNLNCSMSKHSIAQAARFIYLNQACFNGVFRVNKKGEYNVPFGKKDHLALPSAEQLQRVADRLATATVRCAPYEEILEKVGESDFVYLDPPYPPLNGTAYFTHYTKDRFGVKDQEDLAELTINATKRKCKIMMTNADTPVIRKLYEELNMRPLPVTRFVTCKKEKYKVSELIITNYEMPDSNGTEVPGA